MVKAAQRLAYYTVDLPSSRRAASVLLIKPRSRYWDVVLMFTTISQSPVMHSADNSRKDNEFESLNNNKNNNEPGGF